jgi:hypothetical protein
MIYVLSGTRELYVKHAIYLMLDKMAHIHNPQNLNVGLVIRFNIIY